MRKYTKKNYCDITNRMQFKNIGKEFMLPENYIEAMKGFETKPYILFPEFQKLLTVTEQQAIQACQTEKQTSHLRIKHMTFNDDLDALDLYINGYGSNYFIDLQEVFFEMKLCKYSPEFIDSF